MTQGVAPAITPHLVAKAILLAERAVLADIETEGVRVSQAGQQAVFELFGMFNPLEHSSEVIDMASEGLSFAVSRGLVELLNGPRLPVRILRRP